MTGAVVFEDQLEIPSLGNLDAFRLWVRSPAFPEQGRIDYIAGRIEVDMSPEDLHRHGTPKTELVVVIGSRVRTLDLGELYTDRSRVVCPEADLSVEPDVVFVSHASLESGRVRLVAGVSGAPDQFVEMEGAPDLIVELVSDSSVRKDTVRLLEAYERTGVREYWLVDARTEELSFQIHQLGPAGYEAVAQDDRGFQYSRVLDRCYRLERSRNRYGRLRYDLREG